MPHLPYPAEAEVSAEAKAILDSFQAAYGRPSHIFRLMSWNAPFLRTASEAWHCLVVEPSSLPRWTKEAVVVITCSAQRTEYCVQGHSHALLREGLTEAQVRTIQKHEFEGFSDPELSIFRFAHKAASDPKSLARVDYEGLAQLGLSNKTILEILGVVWANTAMNMIVDALGVARTDEQMKELKIG